MATPSAAAPAPSAKELEMADPGPGATQHRATAERLELLPWGDGSAPSLPSVDNGSNFGVSQPRCAQPPDGECRHLL